MSNVTEVGKIGQCSRCRGKKIIFYESRRDAGYIRYLCNECYEERCFCDICNVETTLSSYEDHLIARHSNEEMATRLIQFKLLPYGNY
jgi:hypothetical protein